jgi:hypothetical protein
VGTNKRVRRRGSVRESKYATLVRLAAALDRTTALYRNSPATIQDKWHIRPSLPSGTVEFDFRNFPLGENQMEHKALKELYVDELRDIYSAENQLVKALPKMAKAATSPKLRAGFEGHLEQTKGDRKSVV